MLPSAGTYFLNAGFAKLSRDEDDEAFCRRLTTEAKVAAIPVSAFHAEGTVRDLVRFCFCKRHEVLDEAVARLIRFAADRTAPYVSPQTRRAAARLTAGAAED